MRWNPVLLAGGLGACALAACGDPDATTADAMVDGTQSQDAMIDAPDPNMPATLADTGLCVDAGCTQITPGILPYTPRWELYSDGAAKKRWIYLPAGAQIDTSDMDHWDFPVGTKLWKEFIRDGIRVETRLVMRVADANPSTDWFYAAYVWNSTQDATTWAEFGQTDANGTQHDVPSKFLCRECHERNAPERVIGFAALQLDLDGAAGEVDLADAIASNWLSAPPAAPSSGPYFPLPAENNIYELPALGYLHANCGHCHNPNSPVANNTPMQLRLTVGALGTLAATPTYTTTVNVEATLTSGTDIVEPGMPAQSVMFQRFTSANAALRMPPVGTEIIDSTTQTLLDNWITNIQ